jgi:hypothetical protein
VGINARNKLDYDIVSAVDLEKVLGKRTHNGWKLNDHLTPANCVACIVEVL